MVRRITVSSHLLAWLLEAFTWKIQETSAQPSEQSRWIERANTEIAPLRPRIRRNSDLPIAISVGTAAILALAMAEYILIMDESEDPRYAGTILNDLCAAWDVAGQRDPSLPKSTELLQGSRETDWPFMTLTRLFDTNQQRDG